MRMRDKKVISLRHSNINSFALRVLLSIVIATAWVVYNIFELMIFTGPKKNILDSGETFFAFIIIYGCESCFAILYVLFCAAMKKKLPSRKISIIICQVICLLLTINLMFVTYGFTGGAIGVEYLRVYLDMLEITVILVLFQWCIWGFIVVEDKIANILLKCKEGIKHQIKSMIKFSIIGGILLLCAFLMIYVYVRQIKYSMRVVAQYDIVNILDES